MPTRDNSEKNQHKSCFPFWSRIEPAIFLFFVLKDPSHAEGCLESNLPSFFFLF